MSIREQLRPLEQLQIAGLWQHGAWTLVHVALIIGALLSWWSPWWPITIVLWGAIAWMDHALLTRLHEAAHAMLAKPRWMNEVLGIAIGTASLTPLTVYRYVHAQHHAHLGREKDPEFWPYNLPGTARSVRLFYAWSELLFGWLLTPALYSVRTAAAWRTIPVHQRQRLAFEWALLIATIVVALASVATLGAWDVLVVAYLVPAWIAGSMQTLRKFTEHLGLFGEGILAMTRTVVYATPAGRLASSSQLHVEHHATHHRWARIPYFVLPQATELVYDDARACHATGTPDVHLFCNHFQAMIDMLPSLLDPRLGPQWATPPDSRTLPVP